MIPIDRPINGRINMMVESSGEAPTQISVKVYEGIFGKVMEMLGWATSTGTDTGVFVNTRSLAKGVLINQGVKVEEITNRVKDKAIEVLLTESSFSEENKKSPLHIKETVKATAELEIHRNQDDEQLYQTKLQEAQQKEALLAVEPEEELEVEDLSEEELEAVGLLEEEHSEVLSEVKLSESGIFPQAGLSREERLKDLLSETYLDAVWSHKEKFKSPETLYEYINGAIDVDGKARDLAPSETHKTYMQSLFKIIDNNPSISAMLQAGGKVTAINSNSSDATRLLMTVPFDQLKMFLAEYKKLPSEHQDFLSTIVKENLSKGCEEREEKKDELCEALNEQQKADFLKFFTSIENQNTMCSGFMHFNFQKKALQPLERIYIQMNKEHAGDLTALLVSKLYQNEKYSGILSMKVAGPQTAGRTDGIVIYIGGASQSEANEQRNKILSKLKKIQTKQPELFGDGVMPFKKTFVRGVATIPELSNSNSFTMDLSKAIVSALAKSKSREDLCEGIVKEFFRG